jgi:hypothetical protein
MVVAELAGGENGTADPAVSGRSLLPDFRSLSREGGRNASSAKKAALFLPACRYLQIIIAAVSMVCRSPFREVRRNMLLPSAIGGYHMVY